MIDKLLALDFMIDRTAQSSPQSFISAAVKSSRGNERRASRDEHRA